jgi:AraC-like DNA-binding protein
METTGAGCRLLLVPTAMERERLISALSARGDGGAALLDTTRIEICGFGLVAAAAMTMRHLLQYRPRHVILAGIAGVSPRQLNRLFAAQLGMPAMRYYRALRLGRAQSLLRNSAMPLTQIALATGFANSSHFSRAYSAQFGHAPSRYR